jgi:hypothetical protein
VRFRAVANLSDCQLACLKTRCRSEAGPASENLIVRPAASHPGTILFASARSILYLLRHSQVSSFESRERYTESKAPGQDSTAVLRWLVAHELNNTFDIGYDPRRY